MEDIPVEELVEENLSYEHDYTVSCERDAMQPKETDNTRHHKSEK